MNYFNAYDYACDKFPETLNYMSEEEINELEYCNNKDEVDIYMLQFHERT